MPIEILEFRPFEKNTLRGFLTVRLEDSGWEFRDICVHQKGSQRWLGMPARPYKKSDGTESWVPLIKMADRKKWRIFEDETFAALDGHLGNPDTGPAADDDRDLPF